MRQAARAGREAAAPIRRLADPFRRIPPRDSWRTPSFQRREQLLELRIALYQLAPLRVDAAPRFRRQEPSQGRGEFLLLQAEVEVAAAPSRRIGVDEFLGERLRVGPARDARVEQ